MPPTITDQTDQLPAGWTISPPGSWSPISPGIRALSIAPGMLLVEFDPNSAWVGQDVHTEGPEELTIVAGGLHLNIAGTADAYVTAGFRVRAERDTWHAPYAGPQGCRLLAFYPAVDAPAPSATSP